MRLIKYLNIIFLLAILPFMLICCEKEQKKTSAYTLEHPDPVFNRSLSEMEMSLPSNNQDLINFTGERTVQFNFSAPREKPELQWSRRIKVSFFDQIIVDSKDCSWLFCISLPKDFFESDEDFAKYRALRPAPAKTLVRLNPDGSISWKQYFYGPFQDYIPVIVCEGAIIYVVKTFNAPDTTEDAITFSEYARGFWNEIRRYKPLHDFSLECIDLEGNTVWRTPSAKVENYSGSTPWRISDNRIMMASGEFNSGEFNIYSISDGKLLETIKFPKWDSGLEYPQQLEPIELPGRGWISFQNDGIVLFDSYLKTRWKYNIAIDELQSQPVISQKNILIFGSVNKLTAISLETGNVLWQRSEYINPETWGSTDDGNTIFTAYSSNLNGYMIGVIDSKGNEVLSSPYKNEIRNPPQPPIRLIIYNDGSFLLPKEHGILLADKNGSLIWSLDLKDLGFDNKTFSIITNLFPAPDGRIVFCLLSNDEKKWMEDYIVSIKSKY